MPRVYVIPGRRRGEALVNIRALYTSVCVTDMNVCLSVFPFNLARRGDSDGNDDDDNLERRIYSV